ncbi:uncharacterized protein LOC132269845 [Cornus florida]|uniref:uncharacterized protein LOC132269845 n=1 Tax=Cornus florida TaxID=4283 RepID=UPI0028969DED|nr:uncharacterized protein LOC132269845 [Cornus florida]
MNDLVFNRKRWDPFKASQQAFTAFGEFLEVSRQHRLLTCPKVPLPCHPGRWAVPALDFLKLNFYAAFNSSCHLCGGGLILRNHLGQPIKVALVFLDNVSNPSLAESLILRVALLYFKRWGYCGVVIEGDCQHVMQLKVSEITQLIIFNDVHLLLRECVGSSLSWVPRSGNSVAHLLSKTALKAECSDAKWSVWPS